MQRLALIPSCYGLGFSCEGSSDERWMAGLQEGDDDEEAPS